MTDEQNNKHIAATSAPPTAASTPATTLQELHNTSNGSTGQGQRQKLQQQRKQWGQRI